MGYQPRFDRAGVTTPSASVSSSTPDWLAGRSIGYVPYREDLSAPGDRRRLGYWAQQRGVVLRRAQPGGPPHDVVVLSARSDVTAWARTPRGGAALVYDFIDSYLQVPRGIGDFARGTGKWALRQHTRLVPSYSAAVIAMCRRADIVVCSSPEQQAVLRRYTDDVRPLLDVHDEVSALPRPVRRSGDPLRFFWEGLPENLRGFAPELAAALGALAQRFPVELHLVTDPSAARWFWSIGRVPTSRLAATLPVVPVLHEWSPSELQRTSAMCDVGLIPLDLADPLASGKPENKLLLMWRLGLPVVTSATPAYRRVMAAAGLDLTCTTSADWLGRLEELGNNVTAREDAAQRGQSYVAENHSPERLVAGWDRVISDALRAKF